MKGFIFGLVIIMSMFAASLFSMGIEWDAILLTVPFTLVGGLLMFFLLKFAHGIKANIPEDEDRPIETRLVKANDEQVVIYQGTVVKEPDTNFFQHSWNIHTGLIFTDPATLPNDPQDSTDGFTDQQNYRLIHESDRNGPVGY